MPDELPVQVKQALANPVIPPSHRALEELIASEKEKSKAEPKPTEEKPAPKKSTKEESARTTELLAKRLGFERPGPEREKKDDKAGEAKDKADAQDKSPKEGEAKPDKPVPDATKSGLEPSVGEGKDKPAVPEEPPKKGKVSKKKEIDPVEIATHAATRAAQEVLATTSARPESQPQRLEKVPGTGDETLSDEERAELTIFREMAESNPAHKSLPQQYLAYLKKAEAYQRDWEKSNPGEEFNPEDDAHDKFFKSAEPKYSPREFAKAEARIEARAIIEKERATTSKEHSELKAQLAVRELEPHIRNVQLGATAEIIKTINEDWLKSIEKDGFQKFSEANPAEGELITVIARNIGPFIAAALSIDHPKGDIPIDLTNPNHREWSEYLTAKESELRTKAPKDRMTEDGRVIVSRAEYAQLPTTRRGSYAYLDADALINMRVAEEAERVQAEYERRSKQFEAWAKSQGWTKASAAPVTQAPANGETKKEEKEPEKKEDVKSPEAASNARIDTSGSAPTIKPDNFLEKSARVLFGRQ